MKSAKTEQTRLNTPFYSSQISKYVYRSGITLHDQTQNMPPAITDEFQAKDILLFTGRSQNMTISQVIRRGIVPERLTLKGMSRPSLISPLQNPSEHYKSAKVGQDSSYSQQS